MEKGKLMKYYEALKQLALRRLQDSMSQTLGLSASVTYPDGQLLTHTSNLCSFCALVAEVYWKDPTVVL